MTSIYYAATGQYPEDTQVGKVNVLETNKSLAKTLLNGVQEVMATNITDWGYGKKIENVWGMPKPFNRGLSIFRWRILLYVPYVYQPAGEKAMSLTHSFKISIPFANPELVKSYKYHPVANLDDKDWNHFKDAASYFIDPKLISEDVVMGTTRVVQAEFRITQTKRFLNNVIEGVPNNDR